MNRQNFARLIDVLEYSIDNKRGLTVPQCPEPVGFNMVAYGAFLVNRQSKEDFFVGRPGWQAFANPEYSDITKDQVDSCGTVACLSGWAGLLSGKELGEARVETLEYFLDIPYEDAEALAMGREYDEDADEHRDLSLRDITAEQALGMLKYYFDNQVVKWPKAVTT